MKKELLKILLIIAAAIVLAVGLNDYLDSNDMTIGELAQDLTEAAGTLLKSGD